ncbi:ABC transporter ATP-binding protein uup [Alkalibacterium sp. AK22]|uniref:ABC-F family ATP-binding cassette domain-containing protein n=1 Tax=Alkalibacterium sp. AK22 TaxID=1229520 RepID=UPI0004529B3E|nr:ABC-F family ATP-binding cassette domain-containing protein [Alkalibacterium sp. AK22]EXJ23594.1 ABC transporter ATP-binding protein uup [Alkalibacterium sp. AK22]
MILLQTQKIARYFGADKLFDNVSLEIQEKSRIGLVGRNGAGKSTLLNILSGKEEPDEGAIHMKKECSIGYLDQHTGLESDLTIWEEMAKLTEHTRMLEAEMNTIEHRLADHTLDKEENDYRSLLDRYDRLQQTFKQANGYGIESEIRSVLHGFRFYEEDYDMPIANLSGGQKTRLALAKLLLQKKDLLILDEPTNHLDIDTLSWLETYLQNYSKALLIVSHDRYFMDKVVQEIYEVSRGSVTHYHGNYSQYLKEKSERIKTEWKTFEKQQKKVAKLEEFVNRNIVRASTTKRAQARRKQLEKMDPLNKPQGDEKSAHFQFEVERDSGQVVLQAEELAVGYKHTPLSRGIDLDVRKEESIAIVGPNGVGKTTLLKTLIRHLSPLEGDIRYGAKVDIGYYDQEQLTLNEQKSVLNEVWDDHPLMSEQSVRTLLGSFLFSGDDVDKTVGSLSGGEKSRVALAKLALEKNNLLLLDEPTNHLDIDSKEVLENALIDFEGTLLFVSHDRYFINRLATKIIELSEDGATVYLGDYDYYVQKKAELVALRLLEDEENAASETGLQDTFRTKASSQNKLDFEAQKEKQKQERKLSRAIESCEQQLEKLETELEKVQFELSQPDVFSDVEKAEILAKENDRLSSKQEELLNEWEALQDELDNV